MFLLLFYFIRVFAVGGFYVITYAMSIHLLYLAILVITPVSEPEEEAALPTTDDEKSRIFVPKVQEFIIWKSMVRVVLICFFCTFFSFLDIPVFWPILVMYFVLLFVAQLGSRISHMVKYKYVPWTTGKRKYVSKD
jgi:Na+/H+ antiporter NhaD/arsenite permease-like protein